MKKFFKSMMLAAILMLPFALQAQSNVMTVILEVNDTTMGYTSPSTGTYTLNEDDEMTITAVPSTGYEFLGWAYEISMGTMVLEEDTIYGEEYISLDLEVDEEILGFTFHFTALFQVALVPDTIYCPSSTCQITINAWDEYGDGWNGGKLKLIQHDTLVAVVSLSEEEEDGASYTVDVCSHYPVVFSWQPGAYDDEVSFTIQDGSQTTVYSCMSAENLSASVPFFTLTSPCATCAAPIVTLDSTTSSTITVSWTGEATSYSLYLNGNSVAPSVTGNSYTFTGLSAATFYTVGIIAHCSATEASNMVILTAMTQLEGNISPTDSTAIFTYNVNDPTMGYVTPSGTFVLQEGDVISVTATAYEGYHLTGWQMTAIIGGEIYQDVIEALVNPMTGIVEEDNLGEQYILTALFESDGVVNPDDTTVTVTYTVNDPTMGYVTPSGTFTLKEGDTISVTATAYAGYEFKYWRVTFVSNTGETEVENTNLDGLEGAVDENLLGLQITIKACFAPIGGEGIETTEQSNIYVYSQSGEVLLKGAEGREVELYDLSGRLLHHTLKADETQHFVVPTTGLYLLRIDGIGTRRVVVKH